MQELAKVDKVLQQPSKEKVLSPTIELNEIAQESVAQLEEVSSTLSESYHISTEEMEHAFKDSAGVRTDWLVMSFFSIVSCHWANVIGI